MFSATLRHIPLKTGVDPVKWMPARCGLESAALPIVAPAPYTRLITPSGSPASCSSLMMKYAEYAAVDAGFQTTVFPISAGLVGRLPAIDVKLKGVTAKTKPSSGRYSSRFQTPGDEVGCSS